MNLTKQDLEFYHKYTDQLHHFNHGNGPKPDLSKEQLKRLSKISGQVMTDKINEAFGE